MAARPQPGPEILITTTEAVPGRDVELIGAVAVWVGVMAGVNRALPALRKAAQDAGADVVVGTHISVAQNGFCACGTAARYRTPPA